MAGLIVKGANEYGEPGNRTAEAAPVVSTADFRGLCNQLREAQGDSTEKVEFTINANTVVSWELNTSQAQAKPPMTLVLRRDDIVVQEALHGGEVEIHKWLQKEKLHLTLEAAITTHLTPAP
jgi:hypothetical protein